MVRTEDACEIIKYALQNEIKVYLDGGQGVDALLKRESRIHNDIDLFVELKHYHDETDQNEEDLNPFYRIKPTNNATKKNRNPNEGAPQSNLDGREW